MNRIHDLAMELAGRKLRRERINRAALEELEWLALATTNYRNPVQLRSTCGNLVVLFSADGVPPNSFEEIESGWRCLRCGEARIEEVEIRLL